MAQSGYTPILLYASGTATNVPLAANLTSSSSGAELALNYADGKLFYKDSGGVVQVLATKGTGSIGGSTTQVQFNNAGALGGSASLTWDGTVLTSSGFSGPLNGTVGATTANTGAFTTLSASSTVSGTGFSTYLASPPAIGGTAAAAGTFTTLTATTVNTQNTFGFKNRIINGAMMIDQRNAGASVTVTTSGQFAVDRFQSAATAGSKFSMQQNAGSVTPPAGFANYLGATSLSSYSVGSTDVFGLRQIVEGFNAADLAWGTANAQPITISFWVRSSLTGTFGLGLGNSGFSRAYAATYTINSANTWEYKTVTIAGDTTGTWLTTNGAGIQLTFGLGYGSSYSGTAGVWNAGSYFMPTGATSIVGTSGATFYITGVQLEKGSTATSFDYRPYGTELALCQRYYQQVADTYGKGVGGVAGATNGLPISYAFPVQMRTTPTLTISANGAANTMWVMATAGTISATPASTWWDQYSFVGIQANSPFTTGAGYFCGFKANAEL